jgi:hypothetical protein
MSASLPRTLCRAAVWIFAVLYLVALALYAIGTFGLFGSDSGPLAGVYLVPLGFPWHFLVQLAPEPAWPFIAAALPMINLLILSFVCRALGPGRPRA